METLPPSRSLLLAVVRPAGSSSPVPTAVQFRDLFGTDPTLRLGTAERTDASSERRISAEALIYTKGDNWATDQSERWTVIVHGETYATPGSSPAGIARGFAEHGLRFAETLNGSYALLVHDRETGHLWAITDRRNSRWLFYGRFDGAHVVTSELAAQPTHRAELDPAGIAWTLSSGLAVHGRTPFKGIRALRGASAHRLDVGEVEEQPYWAYRVSGGEDGRSRKQLEDRLYELVVEACRRSFQDSPRVMVSLSVGWDLTAVLGVMTIELGMTDFESFSYANGPPVPDADAAMSAVLAERLALRHRTVESYDGDLVNHIAANARFGGGVGNICDEIDAWRTVGALLEDDPTAIICTGDQRFGGAARDFGDEDAVLHAAGLRPLELPRTVRERMSDADVNQMERGIEGDRVAALAACPKFDNLNDLHDQLRWDQRLPYRIMPWRERFASRFAPVRAPLLDKDLVDFISGLPTDLRRGKALFKVTATARFPDLYHAPRARVSGYEIDLNAEIRRHSERLLETVLAGTSRLDVLIPPDAFRELFVLAGGALGGAGALGRFGRRQADRVTRKINRGLGRSVPALTPRRLGRLFRRTAVLREALRV